ncbi:pentatricopeptide repeat-containing protein At3g57430, chloroplastic [Carica papaya]|uniref:pentatricopeptide repeat-containing protein At3g57430, chloroplastic n=1 Tax=Carica papaya TaxID=3649 RepID=UPI000B8C8506|nr:pentatricopeptide repeat-containing protein At3g57430, chloroplastic [Carica papaya]
MCSSAQSHFLLSLPSSSPPLLSSFQKPNHIPCQSSQPSTSVTALSPTPISHSRSHPSWIESIRSKTNSNLFHEAVLVYVDMILSGVPPDNFAFPAVLKAVTALHDLDLGRQIHAHVFKFGYGYKSVTVANTLVNMYSKCGDVVDVYKVFDKIVERDQVSWNSMIAALCRIEEWGLALDTFRLMLDDNVAPSSFTLVSMALACSNIGLRNGLKLGKQVHAYSLRTGDCKTFTNNALMAMYAKLGRDDDAKALFELFEERDLVSWNTMLSSLSQCEQFKEALSFLGSMVSQGIKPDGVTIASVLPACSQLEKLDLGKEIHAYALRKDILIENSYVGSALVDMYCNCRQVESGRQVFDSILDRKIGLFNAMITGYAQNEYDEEALMLFIEMEEVGRFCANATTIASIVPACVRCERFPKKEVIHGYVIKRGLDGDRFVQNALMDMYARMGKVEISEFIFDGMNVRDIVSWNTMLTGYAISESHDDAFLLLHEMQCLDRKGNVNDEYYKDMTQVAFKPNSITLMTVLPGCAALAALAKGKEIHAYAVKNMLVLDVAVGSALVDMYAKCGCLNISRRVFDQMPIKNVITWNVIIMAYGMHGKGQEALELFRNMVAGGSGAGVKPNEVTYIAIFAACSHSGMVEEGLDLFHKMKKDHGIESSADHYACIVDLLGRAGRVEEAYQLINSMPAEFDKAGA